MDWIQVLTIIGTVVGAAAWLHSDLKWLHSDLRTTEARLDAQIGSMREAQAAQNARTDQLYNMFCDLLKQQKEK